MIKHWKPLCTDSEMKRQSDEQKIIPMLRKFMILNQIVQYTILVTQKFHLVLNEPIMVILIIIAPVQYIYYFHKKISQGGIKLKTSILVKMDTLVCNTDQNDIV